MQCTYKGVATGQGGGPTTDCHVTSHCMSSVAQHRSVHTYVSREDFKVTKMNHLVGKRENASHNTLVDRCFGIMASVFTYSYIQDESS